MDTLENFRHGCVCTIHAHEWIDRENQMDFPIQLSPESIIIYYHWLHSSTRKSMIYWKFTQTHPNAPLPSGRIEQIMSSYFPIHLGTWRVIFPPIDLFVSSSLFIENSSAKKPSFLFTFWQSRIKNSSPSKRVDIRYGVWLNGKKWENINLNFTIDYITWENPCSSESLSSHIFFTSSSIALVAALRLAWLRFICIVHSSFHSHLFHCSRVRFYIYLPFR